MSDTVTIKLTHEVRAAAKRLAKWDAWVKLGDDRPPQTVYRKYPTARAAIDMDRLARAVLRALKGGAK